MKFEKRSIRTANGLKTMFFIRQKKATTMTTTKFGGFLQFDFSNLGDFWRNDAMVKNLGRLENSRLELPCLTLVSFTCLVMVQLKGTNNETRLRYQSERSKFADRSFKLQVQIGLVLNGTENRIRLKIKEIEERRKERKSRKKK